MKLKEGVRLDGVQPAAYFAMGVMHALYESFADTNLIVTSANDSHLFKPFSLHNKGLAFDCRIFNVKPEEYKAIFNRAKEILYRLGYDVVLEKDHLHCEYQPKGGRKWI